MSAASTVLHFRYREPQTLRFSVDPKAERPVQKVQFKTGDGITRAERELMSCGFDRTTSQHLTRAVLVAFLSAFDGTDHRAGLLSDVFVDRVNKEGWMHRLGGR